MKYNSKSALTLGLALLLSLAFMTVSCGKKQDIRTVKMGNIGDVSGLASFVSEVSFIELSEDDSHLLGGAVDLYPLGNDYLLVDKMNAKIYRFAADGEFLNVIGHRGNGPGEYQQISGVQVLGNEVVVFTFPYGAIRYDINGAVLSEHSYESLGISSVYQSDGLLTYYGHGGSNKHRIVYLQEDGSSQGFLESRGDILNLNLGNQIFSKGVDGGVCFLDGYGSTIYKFHDGNVNPYISFDFGEYNIPESFYSAGDMYKGAELLMSSDYALIYKYSESGRYRLVQVNLTDSGSPRIVYGLCQDDGWSWFSLDDIDKNSVSGTLNTLIGDTLYAVINPEGTGKFPNSMLNLSENPEVLQKAASNNNHVIAKITLE